jgi:hypothetical protein
MVNNLDGAMSFATFILSTTGKNILEKEGFNIITPAVEGNTERIPYDLMDLLEEKGTSQSNNNSSSSSSSSHTNNIVQ